MTSTDFYLETQKELFQQLEKIDINFLDSIVAKSPELSLELAEVLFNFYLKYDKLEPFYEWAIQREVQSSKSYGELFREDCTFGLRVIQCMLFTDNNIKFLRTLLGPMLKDILALDKDITLTYSEDTRGLKSLLRILSNFVMHLETVANKVPKNLIGLFACIHKASLQKYPEQETPFIFNFIIFYFICPVLVNPKKYDIIKQVPRRATGLVYASKILNDVASGAILKQSNPLIVEFIANNRQRALETVLKILELDIKEIKMIFTEEEKKAAFLTFLETLDEVEKKPQPSDYELLASPEIFNFKLKKLQEKAEHPGWKKELEKKKVLYYSLKEENSDVIAVKVVTTINASINIIEGILHKLKYSKEFNPAMSHCEILRSAINYEEVYMQFKLPFPFSNRDVAISVYRIQENPYHLYAVYDNLATKFCPKKAGFVRSLGYIGGFIAISDESNPNKTVLTRILHIVPGGSVPAWFTFYLNMQEGKKVKQVRELAEAEQKKL